ncbi:MAG: alpha/beta hydrolase [Planctomycetota bacterium]|nr:alpha/beta hydrolase [Planctomycetota bacterium]
MNPELERTTRIDEGSGPDAIVCLHGWCCRTGDFIPQVEELSQHCRMFVLDWQQRLIERGGSCDFDDICRDIMEAVAEAGIERPLLCGHSLGGFLAAQLAFTHRMPIRGVLILDSTLPLPDEVRQVWQSAARRLESGPYREVFPGIESPFFIESEAGEIRDSIMRAMSEQPPGVGVGLLDAICSYEWDRELVGIDVPVHMVASQHGILNLDAFHAYVPDATSERIEHSGHFITVFHPDEVNAAMKMMLARTGDD